MGGPLQAKEVAARLVDKAGLFVTMLVVVAGATARPVVAAAVAAVASAIKMHSQSGHLLALIK